MIHAARGDARRLLWSKMVVDHHLSSQDPFAIGDGVRENEIADLLLGDDAVAMDQVAAYL